MEILKTKCGEIKGIDLGDGVVAYKGIRYATAKRFEYPVEVTSWDGVYDATKYGNCAYQPRSFYNEEEVVKKAFYYNEFRRGETYTYSEDCLFLNIFAPKKTDKKLPVIIHIHGGSFTGGCGHEKHFDGPIWPKKGVIAVTINYRLGPLGFAILPQFKDESGRVGNYALYDQLTAFEWVKHNIEEFGGDKDNITIMGQSAGAMSVQYHCLSPLTKGLFNKAVMCSGGGVSSLMAVKKKEKHYDYWLSIMEKCGAKTKEEMLNLPVEILYKVWQENQQMSMGGGCTPCIDGSLIVDASHKLVRKKKQHNIPYLIGTTSEDIIPPILYSMAKDWCKKNKGKAYQWFFERRLPGDDNGAWHSSDLWYWFGTQKNCWRPFENKDFELSDEMGDRLVAFARTGSPNVKDKVEWKADGKTCIIFGDNETKIGSPSVMKMWKTMFTNHAPGE